MVCSACRRNLNEQKVTQTEDIVETVVKEPVESGSLPDPIGNSHTTEQPEDPSYINIDKKLIPISVKDYKGFNAVNKPQCELNASGFVKSTGLTIESECGDICETYLVEKKSGKTMCLPADYDFGLYGVEVSPSCSKFITYSSYDGPDYVEYYGQRALVMLYRIGAGSGIKAIKLKKTFAFKLWSIHEAKWVNDRYIALKMYKVWISDTKGFSYFKVRID